MNQPWFGANTGLVPKVAYAEGNALGKGPVVFHIPHTCVAEILRLSRIEKVPAFQQLDLHVLRVVALGMLESMKVRVGGVKGWQGAQGSGLRV